jgi:hypothetical protein
MIADQSEFFASSFAKSSREYAIIGDLLHDLERWK